MIALSLLAQPAAVMADSGQGRPGLFGFLVKGEGKAARDAARAERKAEREARREARKAARKGEAPAVAEDAARAEVKAKVTIATSNRPKGRLWCVPFARAVTGVEIRGNAKTWWSQAEGVYDRGHEPKVGAVMAFAGSRAMPKGHVAVVSKVISPREILVDHANWDRNQITTDQLVVDVSDANDWSVVRVANDAGTLGRTNPVNGFIYN